MSDPVTTTPAASPVSEAERPHLRRVLGRRDLVLLFVVAIFNLNVLPSIAANGGENEAEAIRISNDTPYGLAAAVWTRDIYKAFRVVKSIRGGIVWVNHMQPT